MHTDSRFGKRLIAIPTSSLLVNTVPRFDIFIKHENAYPLLITKNAPINKATIERIEDNGIELLYIQKQDSVLYDVYNKENNHPHEEKKDSDLSKNSTILYTSTLQLMKQLFDEKITEESIKLTKEIAEELLLQTLSDQKAFSYMLKVLSYDYNIYTHSTNVCLYSIILGRRLGLSDERLQTLAEGSLLHNIGKLKIDKKIINKGGKLTLKELHIIRLHPVYGKSILEKNGERDEDLLDIVSQHHEKLNGTGYPYQLDGRKINYLAQIVTVADIFDALTTNRPYRSAISSYEAFSLMHSHMQNEINMDILEEFIKCFKG